MCLLVREILSSSVIASNDSCPTWLYYSSTTQQCECGFHRKWIHCNQQDMDVQIRSRFCVTYSGKIGLFYGGICPFSYKSNSSNRLFSKLCTSPEELETAMCGSYNRKGFQCGECLDGYGFGVYTMRVKCAQCSNYSVTSATLLYLLVPIVIFFICVMVFRLNLMSGPMLGYVLFCQGVAFSIEYDGVIFDSYLPASLRIPLKMFLVVYN